MEHIAADDVKIESCHSMVCEESIQLFQLMAANKFALLPATVFTKLSCNSNNNIYL